jgi:hypothetical protein
MSRSSFTLPNCSRRVSASSFFCGPSERADVLD